jgi:hypothetical protein
MQKRKHRIVRVTGGRVAVMNTSVLPDSKVDEAIRYIAKAVELDATIIHVKRHGRNRATLGMAYRSLPSITNTNGLRRWEWKYLITVTDADFLHTLAHEAKHVEQFREGLPIRERRCNAFADGLTAKFKSRTAPEGAARQPA